RGEAQVRQDRNDAVVGCCAGGTFRAVDEVEQLRFASRKLPRKCVSVRGRERIGYGGKVGAAALVKALGPLAECVAGGKNPGGFSLLHVALVKFHIEGVGVV